MTCETCKGTGRILLLTSYVPCDCVGDMPSFDAGEDAWTNYVANRLGCTPGGSAYGLPHTFYRIGFETTDDLADCLDIMEREAKSSWGNFAVEAAMTFDPAIMVNVLMIKLQEVE